jgi:hypothetical protein
LKTWITHLDYETDVPSTAGHQLWIGGKEIKPKIMHLKKTEKTQFVSSQLKTTSSQEKQMKT